MTFDLATSPDSPSAISSQELESGHTPCAVLGGLTIGQFGQALAPANLSATQAAALGLMMSGTSGRRGSNSSRSASLQSFLGSRLRARTASVGSTLFTLTWKQRATPSGLQICALRASARRTSDNDSGLLGWPTPDAGVHGLTDSTWEARRAAAAAAHGNNGFGLTVAQAASLAAWPTPNARDFKCGPTETYAERSGTTKGDSLSNLVTAVCGSWATPLQTDHRSSNGDGSNPRDVPRQAALASWATPRAEDSESSGMRWGRGVADTLTAQAVVLAGWPTPMAGTPAQNGNNAAGNNDSSRQTVALASWGTPTVQDSKHATLSPSEMARDPANLRVQVHQFAGCRLTATGLLLTGSTAETAAGGQLNPGHSRWLMGLPSVWDDCGVTGMALLRQRPKRSSRHTSTSRGA